MDQECLIALGSNLPNDADGPLEICRSALSDMAAMGLHLRRISRFYRTPAFPAGAGPDYINATCQAQSDLSAQQILDVLHSIEARYERRRDTRWGARTLDLDLLTLGHFVAPDRATFMTWHDLPPEAQANHSPGQLILPHPRLQDRAFVLVPLMDIAPDWRHPVLDRTIAQMHGALDPADVGAVTPL